jgi:hypothetical protein
LAGVLSGFVAASDFSGLLDPSLLSDLSVEDDERPPSPSLALLGLLSVIYQPDPLNTTPTG